MPFEFVFIMICFTKQRVQPSYLFNQRYRPSLALSLYPSGLTTSTDDFNLTLGRTLILTTSLQQLPSSQRVEDRFYVW